YKPGGREKAGPTDLKFFFMGVHKRALSPSPQDENQKRRRLNDEQIESLRKLDQVRPLVNYLLRMAAAAEKVKLSIREELDPCIILGIHACTPVDVVTCCSSKLISHRSKKSSD